MSSILFQLHRPFKFSISNTSLFLNHSFSLASITSVLLLTSLAIPSLSPVPAHHFRTSYLVLQLLKVTSRFSYSFSSASTYWCYIAPSAQSSLHIRFYNISSQMSPRPVHTQYVPTKKLILSPVLSPHSKPTTNWSSSRDPSLNAFILLC